jgi:carbonic anhydrase/acetyltransferase-like protein (isoleucine patch superfamily)
MNTPNKFHSLFDSEIRILQQNGCKCNDWSKVKAGAGFDPSRCQNTVFSGNVLIGDLKGSYTDKSGVTMQCGISNAHIHNCNIGSDVLIVNIGDYIANYDIEDNVVIKNCGKIHTEGESAFGNGTEVAVLNEAGGRSVTIWDKLSAQQAYIIALYRHRAKAVKKIEQMVADYSKKVTSDRGVISRESLIINCRHIRNVKIGPYSKVEGAMSLNEGSINSCKEDPVFIGPGVIMEHFIVCSGSIVTESTLIDKCFIGQGCVLGKHYSAENSLFFANCAGFHGEACSIFAGPYTVTHHKSTLLIAGIFSFMNAGSGSNQSNHMYKLGPIHQGIMERGSKTTSDSYLLWPARIGPFTLVMGRHYKNMDTSSLPFSYLIESNDESILVPGVNLRSVGTIRDAQKWPKRDRRKDPVIIDQVNFNLLSPYTIRKMFEGRDLLCKIKSVAGPVSSSYSYNNMIIKGPSLDRGIELYQTGINKFLGNSLIKRLENTRFKSSSDLQKKLTPDRSSGNGEWVDLAGLIAPQRVIDKLLTEIESGKLSSLEAIEEEFRNMHKSYYEWEWIWACERLEKEIGKSVSEITAADVRGMVEKWKKSVIDLDKMLYEDARKEFNLSSRTGFGIDGGEDVKKLDFEEVRGDFESNSVVSAIQDHIKQKTALGDELIERINEIK